MWRFDLETLDGVSVLTEPKRMGSKLGFQAALNDDVITIYIDTYQRDKLVEEISKKAQSGPVSIVVNRVPWISGFGRKRKSGITLYLMEIKES